MVLLMGFKDLLNKIDDIFSNVVAIIVISISIVVFCAAGALVYKFISTIALVIKGNSPHYDLYSKVFWFDKDFFDFWIKGMIGCFILLAIGFIGSHFEERRMKKIKQDIETFGINGESKIAHGSIQSIKSGKMGWKIIIGGILVAFSGPCLPLLYRDSGGDLFINWIILSLASLILIFGSLILAKGVKEYLN